MQYTEITYRIEPDQSEVLLNQLTAHGICSVSVEDYHDLLAYTGEYPPELVGEDLLLKMAQPVAVHCYFEPGEEDMETLQRIAQQCGATLSTRAVEEQDWANNWKQFYKTRRVGKKLWIRPSWEPEPDDADGVVVQLDPGMAFGTGTHETTMLCLQELEACIPKWASPEVLDVGCGSGILGIAALKLGAAFALGIDLDPAAVETARENACINGVDEHFEAICGNLVEKIHKKFDLVVVNIVADAIIDLLGSVRKNLCPGGVLIVSGIVDTRAQDVKAALERADFVVEQTRRDKDWILFRTKPIG